MKELLRKKVNLLVHLAKIDGKLDVAEQEMLQELLREHGITDFSLKPNRAVDLSDYRDVPSREEILFLALRMIRIDGIIHPDEVAYCKALAIKLDFNPDMIDHYTKDQFPDLASFTDQLKNWEKAH